MPTIPASDWYERACADMVRNGKTLFRWSNEHNKGLTSTECENVARTKEFQACLRAERNKLYAELAKDPTRSKNTALGQMLFAIQKLIENEQFDKAVAAITQLAKLEGWTTDSTQVSIINDISSKDIDALRQKLRDKLPKTLVN
jgi:hypothetical protein